MIVDPFFVTDDSTYFLTLTRSLAVVCFDFGSLALASALGGVPMQ